MGLCQSDTRDQSKLTLEPLRANPEFPAQQPNQSKSDQSHSQDMIHMLDSEHLLRTNINIHEINNSNNALEASIQSRNKDAKLSLTLKADTYMHLTLPPTNQISTNQVFLNQSFANQQTENKLDEKKIQNLMESVPHHRDSIYHRRISQLTKPNLLSQININSNPLISAGNEMSLKQLNEENNQIVVNENE